jgi:hypothetical protein
MMNVTLSRTGQSAVDGNRNHLRLRRSGKAGIGSARVIHACASASHPRSLLSNGAADPAALHVAVTFERSRDRPPILTAIGFSQGDAARNLKLFERIALVGTVKAVPPASPATIDAAQ